MGGKRNKSKKFLQKKWNKKHNKNNKKKNKTLSPSSSKTKSDHSQTKKSRELFNAGINALNEQPQLDVGLTYNKSDLISYDNDYNDYDDDINSIDDDISDVTSLKSEVTLDDDMIFELENDINNHIIDNELDDLLDDLMNKDTSIRISSLNKLNNQLRSRKINENDFCDKNQHRLQIIYKYLSYCIRRGSINEQQLALDTAALISVSLNADAANGLDFFVKNFQSQMLQLIKTPKSAVIQIKAINIWATLIWCLNDNDLKIRTLKLFEYFWNYNQWNNDNDNDNNNQTVNKKKKKKKNKYKTPVVSTVSTSIDPSVGPSVDPSVDLKDNTDDNLDNDNNNNIVDNVDNMDNDNHDDDNSNDDDTDNDGTSSDNSSDNTVKTKISGEIMAAAMDAWLFLITSIGTASGIGLLLDTYCNTLLKLLKLPSTSVSEKIHIGKALTVLIDNYNTACENDIDFDQQNVNLDGVMKEFNRLKTDSKQHRKKQFALQKTKFRDYLKTLEHKWTPIVVIKLHHKKFEMSGWNKWIQFHFIKKLLNNGLQPHLLQNTSLKEAFDIDIDPNPIVLSKKDKLNQWKHNVSKQAKLKQQRKKKRDKKNNFQFDKSLVD